MAIKLKPHGPRCKRFQIWTKVAKLPKPQGPKWQFTLFIMYFFDDMIRIVSNQSVLYYFLGYWI
ncbi:hypothetical protein Hanom_Chr04g00324161 [Helianthus anomalus]